MPSIPSDPWSDEELLRTVANYGGVGADADQADPVRFLRGVARLIKKRLSKNDEVVPAPAVFLLCPAGLETVDEELLEDHPMLDNGRTPISGRLWLVNPVVVAGKSIELDDLEDSSVFDFVVKVLERGQVPTVIYEPRVDPIQIRFYPSGLRDADCCDVIEIPTGLVDLDAVLAVVDRVYKTKLITPSAQSTTGKLWRNAREHWVEKDAELRIQMYLETALWVAFPTCTVRTEQSGIAGRLDIEIEEPDPRSGKYTKNALLELKVIRSFGSTGRPRSINELRAWVDEGVDQAYAYREDRGARQSALCCFDMRKSHEDTSIFEFVAEKAERLVVNVRVWCLFASVKDYRAFRSSQVI